MKHSIYRHRQHGFTLTEILVGIAIGLFSILVMYKALQSSNVVSSNVSGGADSSVNAQIALYLLERDILMAGYGINHANAVGCNIAYSNDNVTLPTDITGGQAIFAPVSGSRLNGGNIVQLRDANDWPLLRVAYAGNKYVANAKLTRDVNGANQPLTVTNAYGMDTPGNVLLITANPDMGNALTGCMIRQTTGTTSNEIQIAAGGGAGMNNSTGLSMQNYQTNDYKVFNIGSVAGVNANLPANWPMWNEYRVNPLTATLEVRNLFMETAYRPVAQNVIDMRVEYVLTDGTIQQMGDRIQAMKDGTSNNLGTSAGWNRITGVRVALLTRSTAPDYSKGAACRTNPNDANTITQPNSPELQSKFRTNTGALVAPFVLDRTRVPEAHCYRYKIQESIITMRNMTWRPV